MYSFKSNWINQIINSSYIGILVVDKNRKNIFVNDRLCTLLGYSKEELLGKSAEIFHISKESYDKYAKFAFECVLEGKPIELEHQYKKKDGSIFWAHISGEIIADEGEVLWSVVDITQRVLAEQKIDLLNDRNKLALLGSNDGIWDWNLLDNSVYYSPRWKDMLGYRDSELKNEFSTWEALIHPDDKESTLAGIQDNIDKKTEFFQGVTRLKHKDGHWVWILDRAKTQYDSNGIAIRMTGTHTDITKSKTLEIQNKRQAEILAQIHDAVITNDLLGNVTSWNHGAEVIYGYTEEEMLGKSVSLLFLEEDIPFHMKNMEELITKGSFSSDLRFVKKNKKIVDVHLSASALHDETGKVYGSVGYSQDITERKHAERNLLKQKKILKHQAHYDILTQLPNRVLFSDRLKQGMRKSKRNGESLALYFIDLDHFKEINDSLGHDAGDEVLKEITTRLLSIMREEDTLSRLGGDEFTVIIEGVNSIADASSFAKKMLAVFEKPLDIKGNSLYLSGSIGISMYPADGDNMQDLLKFADSAMYKAKDEGRNNFQFYSADMTEMALNRVMLESSLRDAIKNEEFVVYYQPQMNAKEEKLVGMEALVRWEHPSMGIISPDNFIPLAESTGLIVELDRFVMRSAFKQFKEWHKKGLNPGVLALNLSVKQLQKKDFLEVLKSYIKDFKCIMTQIELEITESQIMNNPEYAISILDAISKLNINIAVDDFGTGYSSLSYLKRLPIKKLKIDKSFVDGLPDDEEDIAITKVIIALAKNLNLNVIAEGVETLEQKKFMLENGCDTIQGYLYSKPLTAEDIEKKFL